MKKATDWVVTGSVISNTLVARLRTDGGIELVLSQAPSGAWVMTCKQLWSDGKVITVAPSDVTAEVAQVQALNAALSRLTELVRSLMSTVTRAAGRAA